MSFGGPPLRDRDFLALREELRRVRIHDNIGNPGTDMAVGFDSYIASENVRDGYINTDEFLETREAEHRAAADLIASYRLAHPNGDIE